MLGDRHAFHAGNHADILKHAVLFECLSYMRGKDKPLAYVDTHAGAGAYVLSEGYAAQNLEWESGLGSLRRHARTDRLPESLAAFEAFLADYERDFPGAYPGSPVIAARLLRKRDHLFLYELHPSDHEELAFRFSTDARASVRKEDGFSALKGLLPPASRRGLVFMDPSYEIVSDYDAVVGSVAAGLSRFATGSFIVWYPLLERPQAKALSDRILDLTDRPRLHLWLRVRDSASGERGMSGSGMIVINPPWPLEAAMRQTLPYLASALGQGPSPGWDVQMLPKLSSRQV